MVSVEPLTPAIVASAAFLYDLIGTSIFATAVHYVVSLLAEGRASFWEVFRAVVVPCVAAGSVYLILSLLSTITGSPTVYFIGVALCLAGKFFSQVVGPALVAGHTLCIKAKQLLLPSLAAYAAMMITGLLLGYYLAALGGVIYVCSTYLGYTATLPGLAAEEAAMLVYVWAAGALFRAAMEGPRR